MNRSTKVKAPSRHQNKKIGSFGKRKFRKIYEYSSNDMPHQIQFGNTSDALFYTCGSNLFVSFGPNNKSQIKSRIKADAVCFALRDDDKLLALCADKRQVEIIDVIRRKPISTFSVVDDTIYSIRLTESSLLCITSRSFTRYDNTGNVLDSFPFASPTIFAQILSDKFSLLGSGSKYFLFNHLEFSLKELFSVNQPLGCISFKNNYLAYSVDNILKVFSLSSFEEISSLRPHSKTITSLNFSDDSKLIYSSSLDGYLIVTDIYSGHSKCLLDGRSPILCGSSRSDTQLAIGTSDGIVSLHSKSNLSPNSSSANPKVSIIYPHVLKYLKRFQFKKAILESLKTSSPDLLVNVITMLNYNGYLNKVFSCLDPKTLNSITEKLIKVVVKYRSSSILIAAFEYLLSTNLISSSNLSLLRERVCLIQSIQDSLLELSTF